jgi:uncharacterized protein (TIGR03663 family)
MKGPPHVKTGCFGLGLLLLIAAGSLVLRLQQLQVRPMHADEAVQAARFRDLWYEGRYVYDPQEYHGPTLTYCTLPAVWALRPRDFAETTEVTYRLVPVIFGVGLVLLLLGLTDALGASGVLAAGLLTAVSPAMVFYSRYYIHETLLVFFTMAAMVAGWRYYRTGRLAWSLAAGACLGMMQATKETSVLVFACLAVATLLALGWTRWLRDDEDSCGAARYWWHGVAGASVGVLIAAIWLTSFLQHPRGLLDGVLTYWPWLGRAGGQSPHVHPWYFYLQRLLYWRLANGPRWSEAVILLLASGGWLAALRPQRPTDHQEVAALFARWLGFFTLGLVLVYSAIPYKTPWCLLGFLHGAILLAGYGVHRLLRGLSTVPLRVLALLGLSVAVVHLGRQAWRASVLMPADPRNPYVYSQTLPDMRRLSEDLEQLSHAAPAAMDVTVKVFWPDGYYWPLPWYLRRMDRVGYWVGLPPDLSAPLVIASPEYDQPLTQQLDATHLMTGYYALRPNLLAQLWVRMDLWEAHLRRLGRIP